VSQRRTRRTRRRRRRRGEGVVDITGASAAPATQAVTRRAVCLWEGAGRGTTDF
jgi:hypothetical protein